MAGRRTSKILRLAYLVIGFAVILGCAIAAGELLKLVERPSGATGVDASITSWAVAHRTSALTTLARALSTLGSQVVLTPVALVAALVLVARRRFVQAGLLVAAWGGAILLYTWTKHAVERMRPPMDIWLTDVGRTSSFPSGHATQSLATFLALALLAGAWFPRVRWPARVLAVVLAAGVGWSRVYLGVHWATDVAAGWLIAATWVAVVVWLAERERSIEGGGREAPPDAPEPSPESEAPE
jgi:undecaprenyl-diphosphatase